MAYHIRYGKTTVKERIACLRSSENFKLYNWIFVGILTVAISLLGRFGALDFLIPGDREITKAAFQTMVEDVREGEHVSDALTAFCEEILAGADYKN